MTAGPARPPLPVPARAVTRHPPKSGPLALDVVHAEWTKLRTVRSTYWTLLAAAVGMVGFGGVLTAAYARHYGSPGSAGRVAFDPTAYSLSGFFLAQIGTGVFGAIVITSEYATGSIQSTFAAVPQRSMVLAAKAAVAGALTTAIGIVCSFASFFIGQAILARKGIQADIGDPGVARSVVGAGLYLAVLGLMALGLGALLRRTAGAVSVFLGLIIVLPVILQGLPASWQHATIRYLPSIAGEAIIGHTKFTPPGHLLAPWAGFAVSCAYTAAALIAGAVTLNRRDA